MTGLNNFSTKDLGEAGALMAAGIKFIGLNKEENGNFYWFDFEREGAKETSAKFWSDDLEVKARKYFDSLKTLKTMVFSRKEY